MLNYNIESRKMTIGKDKGKTKYFAQRTARGVMKLEQVEDEIVRATSLAKGDVRNAIASLAEVVNNALLSGLKVDLGDLGSLSVEANGKMMDKPELVDASTIKKPQIRYNPKQGMRKHAQSVSISVYKGGDASAKPKAEAGSASTSPTGTGHAI